MRTLFGEYEAYHRDPVNVAIHKLAVPAIMFHVIAMLDWVRLTGPVTLGMLVVAAASVWYLAVARRYAWALLPFSGLCVFAGRLTPQAVVVTIAVVAWVAQLVGHARFERRAPAFKDNLVQLLVGPAYVVALLMGDWPEREEPLDS